MTSNTMEIAQKECVRFMQQQLSLYCNPTLINQSGQKEKMLEVGGFLLDMVLGHAGWRWHEPRYHMEIATRLNNTPLREPWRWMFGTFEVFLRQLMVKTNYTPTSRLVENYFTGNGAKKPYLLFPPEYSEVTLLRDQEISALTPDDEYIASVIEKQPWILAFQMAVECYQNECSLEQLFQMVSNRAVDATR